MQEHMGNVSKKINNPKKELKGNSSNHKKAWQKWRLYFNGLNHKLDIAEEQASNFVVRPKEIMSWNPERTKN